MPTPQEFAARFERTLDLFRDPGAKEEQKTQFRTLAGLLKREAVAIAVLDGRLLVNGTAVDGATLLQRLEFHSVKEIAIPADPPVAEVFELLRALAEQPGDEDIASGLRASRATRVSVRMQTFVFGTPIVPVAPQPAPAPTPAPTPAPPPQTARANRGADVAPAASGAEDIPDIVREATARSVGFSPAAAATRTTADLIAQLSDEPDGPHVGDMLAVLGRQLETAMKSNRTTQALIIGSGIVRAELAGELALEEAVPALAKQLEHEDERVRKAVALALAKIGSSSAAEPLRRALRDKSPEVRIQAALGVGGRKSAALAMPLVAAMEEEADEAVERELILALGRIGS